MIYLHSNKQYTHMQRINNWNQIFGFEVEWILLVRRIGRRKDGVRSTFINFAVLKATDSSVGESGVNSWWFRNFSKRNRHGLFTVGVTWLSYM